MHMVVAIPRPCILRNDSTCMPHANEVRLFASRLRLGPMNATPKRISASMKMETWRQCSTLPRRAWIISASMMPSAKDTTGSR